MQTDTSLPRPLIRRTTAHRLCGGQHDSTFLRWERQGFFPRRITISPGLTGYYQDEIETWIANRREVTHVRQDAHTEQDL